VTRLGGYREGYELTSVFHQKQKNYDALQHDAACRASLAKTDSERYLAA
jgi:hypothetical protein